MGAWVRTTEIASRGSDEQSVQPIERDTEGMHGHRERAKESDKIRDRSTQDESPRSVEGET